MSGGAGSKVLAELAAVASRLEAVAGAPPGTPITAEDAWLLVMALRRLAIFVDGVPGNGDIVAALRRAATEMVDAPPAEATLAEARRLLRMLEWRLHGERPRGEAPPIAGSPHDE